MKEKVGKVGLGEWRREGGELKFSSVSLKGLNFYLICFLSSLPPGGEVDDPSAGGGDGREARPGTAEEAVEDAGHRPQAAPAHLLQLQVSQCPALLLPYDECFVYSRGSHPMEKVAFLKGSREGHSLPSTIDAPISMQLRTNHQGNKFYFIKEINRGSTVSYLGT